MRVELRYSKSTLNLDEKKIANNYFGKRPTAFGVFLISIGMGAASFIATIPLSALYELSIINDVWYFVLAFIAIIIMCILDIKAMDRYFDGKK